MEIDNRRFTKSETQFRNELRYLREFHQQWKEFNKENNIGFFQIFSQDFKEKLLSLSGNAVKLYVYLGTYANSNTGELTVSVERMQDDLKCTRRSIHNWLKELADAKLIKRLQQGYKTKTHTFLLPYNQQYIHESKAYFKIAKEILNDN